MTDGMNRDYGRADYTRFSTEVALRYRREAKERMRERIGEDLTEEFFSVAGSTELNVENVAELMAAAYKMGKDNWPEGIRSYRRML